MKFLVASLGLLLLGLTTVNVAADNQVRMEVLSQPGIPITAMQRWGKALSELKGGSVKLRSGRDGETAKIEEVDLRSGKLLQVTAILDTREVLHLPDGTRLTRRELSKLEPWINKLKVGGQAEMKREPGPFGLTKAEFDALYRQLSKPVSFETAGNPLNEVIGQVGREASLEFRASDITIAQVGRKVAQDELKGVSSGTALSILLRPYGWALVPKRELGGAIHLHVLEIDAAKNSWPIGWESPELPNQLSPVMFQFIEVEIKKTPLEEVLSAIGGRVKTPMYRDHYKIEKHKIDIASVQVRYPKGRTFYKKILDTVLYQGLLTLDLKVDEAGNPFPWITSAKRD